MQAKPLMHLKGANPKGQQITLTSKTKRFDFENLMTLKQAYPSEYQRVQGAFKDSMIHWILQFTLLIAFRCVLHRCESQEIRCWKLYYISPTKRQHILQDNRRVCNKKLSFSRARYPLLNLAFQSAQGLSGWERSRRAPAMPAQAAHFKTR